MAGTGIGTCSIGTCKNLSYLSGTGTRPKAD
jgi:hypothetical protein